MSTQIAKVLVPSPVAVPRGAEWVSELVTELPLLGKSVWASLVAVEEARAQHEQERLEARHAHESELASTQHDAVHCGNRG